MTTSYNWMRLRTSRRLPCDPAPNVWRVPLPITKYGATIRISPSARDRSTSGARPHMLFATRRIQSCGSDRRPESHRVSSTPLGNRAANGNLQVANQRDPPSALYCRSCAVHVATAFELLDDELDDRNGPIRGSLVLGEVLKGGGLSRVDGVAFVPDDLHGFCR